MLNIVEITDLTGNAYISESENYRRDLPVDRIITPDSYQIISDETGKDNKQVTIHEDSDYIQDIFPYRLLASTTGADIQGCQELLIIIGTEIASHNNITNTSFFINEIEPVRKRKKFSPSASTYLSRELNPSRKKYEIVDLANDLRRLSGLDIASLASLFKVSRATYHRWLRGLPVSKKHCDLMLEILPLIEEAAQRLGSPESVNRWLLTPVSAGNRKPIEYLIEKQYDLFRGFLLHQRTGKEQFRPLKPSRRTFRPRKREEIEDVREQLRPHTWYDEDDSQ